MSTENSISYSLICPECSGSYDPFQVQTYCHDCNSPLLARYDLQSLRLKLDRDEIRSRSRGTWRWHELLPVQNELNRVTLGEGDTPVFPLSNLGNDLGLSQLWLKDESQNPTGSFKARGMAVAVSKAIELGLHEFVIPTAGNAGGALASYAGRSGSKAHVYMPTDTPQPIQTEVMMAGADLHLVNGLISDAARLAAADAAQYGWFDFSTFKEPFRVEGKKIMGYELAEAFQWQLPDVIVYPTGGGTGLVGMWKAFEEMQALGWIGAERPRMVSVQAEGCAPVVKAFHEGAHQAAPWQNATTIALGLRVPAVFAGQLVLTCLRESRGTAVSVSDEEILLAQKELARREGVWAAPEGAATLAGIKKLLASGWCKKDEKIVLFNTGSGLKYFKKTMPEKTARTPLEILYSISRELATSLDLHKVLSRVLVLSTANIGAERASLIVLNQLGQPVDAAIIYDGVLTSATMQQMEDVLKFGLAGWVVRNKQPVLIPNTHKDKRWLVKPDEANKQQDLPKSALCVPLMAREQLVGVLTIVHPKVNFFTAEQFKLQQAIADLSGIAIRNAQLYEDVQGTRNRYYELFESSIDPILIADPSGRIIEANQQAISTTGYTREELVLMDISRLHDLSNAALSKVLQKNSPVDSARYESRLNTRESGIIPVEVHVSRIHIQGGDFIQWIFRDISEKRNLDSLREDLSAMIYHDLRSPLANITSSLEIMTGILAEDQTSQVKQLLEIASRSTSRMQRLISSLLDINRLEAGQTITQKSAVDVELLINEAVETTSSLVQNKGIKIEKLIPAAIPRLLVDEDMIRRVIINLLENACKFSPQNARIIIGAKLNGNQITLWVEDYGPGIPLEAREHIFDKFVRLRSEGATRGLGLGLAFCRLAVQAHGGKIWVENIADGGSRFIFTLPAAASEKIGS